MSNRNGLLSRFGFTACLVVALSLASAASASATATIGQLPAANPPPAICSAGSSDANAEYIEPTVANGPSYVVPAGGVAITSWSTKAAAVAGQIFKLKVFRKVTEPLTYQVVGHDGPRTLTPGALNTFPVNLPVQAGDVIGLFYGFGPDAACRFASPGNAVLTPAGFGDTGDGQTVSFDPDPFTDESVNLSAVVAFKTSNDFDFVKVKKNKSNGTATLTVDVPGPGTLSLTGSGVKPQRHARASGALGKKVTEAGKVKLRIKAKGAKKEKLLDTGKVKVKVKVRFTPAATGGDVAGDPNTEPKKIKLIDN